MAVFFVHTWLKFWITIYEATLFIFIFSSKVGQPSDWVRQQEPSSGLTEYQALCSRDGIQKKSTTLTGFSQRGQKSFVRAPNPIQSQQSKALPAPVPSPNKLSARAVQPQSSSWKFTNSFGPQRPPFEGNRVTNQKMQTAWKNQVKNMWKTWNDIPKSSVI